jgi:hypothetical protein
MLLLPESESLYDWRFTANQFVLVPSPLRLTARIFSQLNTCGHSPYITSSLTKGLVCHLQLLLALASALVLGYECPGTRDHILLSQIRDLPCCASYYSQGYGEGIRPRLHTGNSAPASFGTLLYNHFERSTQKTEPLYCREGVFIVPLYSNGSYAIVVCLFVAVQYVYRVVA